jgi:hypothetical protein
LDQLLAQYTAPPEAGALVIKAIEAVTNTLKEEKDVSAETLSDN